MTTALPLLVAVVLAGALASCGAFVTLRRVNVTLVAFVLGVLLCGAAIWGSHPASYPGVLLFAALAAAVVAFGLDDAFRGRISDVITYPAMLVLLVLGGIVHGWVFTLVGGLVCGSFIFGFGFIHDLTARRAERAKDDAFVSAIGLGDVKAGILIGLAIGAQYGALTIAAAAVLGVMAVLLVKLLGASQPGDRIRFGPYLAYGVLFSTSVAPHVGL